jgi:hypothetical protein
MAEAVGISVARCNVPGLPMAYSPSGTSFQAVHNSSALARLVAFMSIRGITRPFCQSTKRAESRKARAATMTHDYKHHKLGLVASPGKIHALLRDRHRSREFIELPCRYPLISVWPLGPH